MGSGMSVGISLTFPDVWVLEDPFESLFLLLFPPSPPPQAVIVRAFSALHDFFQPNNGTAPASSVEVDLCPIFNMVDVLDKDGAPITTSQIQRKAVIIPKSNQNKGVVKRAFVEVVRNKVENLIG